MATRDVILKALQGWCWIGGAPLHLRALDSYDLERIADVAAGAVEGQKPVGTPAEADACAGRSGLGEVGA